MPVTWLIWIVALLAAASCAGVLYLVLRHRAAIAPDATELVARLGASESTSAALRQQLDALRRDLDDARNRLAAEQQARVAAETRLEAAARDFEERKRLLDEARTKLTDTFKALSADALKTNAQEFVKQAEERIKPLRDVLEKYEKQVVELEKARVGAYEGIREQMKSIGAAHLRLSEQTGKLVTALRAPHVRGRWGEITLQRVVEAAGMSPHCDFDTQPSTDTDDGRRRPDLVVRLPGNRTIVVDAKTPLKDYVDAVETDNEESRQSFLRRHAAAVRSHMQGLSGKAYWNQFDRTPDFVVMFLPGESFFSAALEQDRDLIEDGFRARVILATPTTLIALLRSVAYSWQQREVAENAERIARTARDLFERISTFAGDHFASIGAGLARAVDAFNKAVRSWESRVVPAGRCVAELGATARDAEFPELLPVETPPASAAPNADPPRRAASPPRPDAIPSHDAS